jgi:hypothetical protein
MRFIPLSLVLLGLSASLGSSLQGAPAKGKKASTKQEAPKPVAPPPASEPEDVPVTSTTWDDGPLQPDALATDPAISGVLSVSGGSLPDVLQSLKSSLIPKLKTQGFEFSDTTDQMRTARMKMLGQMGDTIFPLPKPGGLIFTTEESRIIKERLKDITFIGSRVTGKVSGAVSILWVEITPCSVKWGDSNTELRLMVDIHLSGDCKRGSEKSGQIVSKRLYSSKQLAKAIAEAIQPNPAVQAMSEQ